MKRILFILAALLLSSCQDPTTNIVNSHPTPVVTDTNLCPTADQHLQDLGCIPKGQPYTKKNESFTTFCQQTQNNGIFLNPRCLSTITTCSEMNVCTGTVPEGGK